MAVNPSSINTQTAMEGVWGTLSAILDDIGA
jgi:hypothetical protein